ncbi:MAG: hypothetical protein A2056_00060 [Deltaproteobacteria bacterium GWA2_42_85]|nr:MAG: hypothetical protein A2056_00060 [Deltaproteobacteria bacterium GWA2_42_85]OGP22850.1 MAG: hypothetical protein A2067_06110 [Deltaproteobacteria bacterium GWB2_42_7]OGP46263.1 MAG: hypothetical protein A2022_12035 [Deltaproteobacteria bacterium GWF2_42_12]OGQ25028.1 MAG: hypothetical protein A3D29_06740 [Deltaproteobacteria bacterium RIFCSPHIGHO2_02_FULL_42_44]OGQ37391.1 MAG: hypothetical protein A3H47_01340 [Deltaproteobacteria bacterium RIFCSPLOWO2_02_FULL_42_39]OGQ69624.1 MAG: hypot
MAVKLCKKKKHYILLSLFVVILFFITIFGERGLIRLYKLSRERDSILGYKKKIETENASLRNEIDLLKNDDKYIEVVARKELGMIGKNELVYQFEK